MPMVLRDKRRSLHLSPNGKLAELTKEAFSRPRSWYLPTQNVDIDPYTSVRKIFYEFPKKAFYGENEENGGVIEKSSPLESDVLASYMKEQSLRSSFTRLDIKKYPSPVPSHKSMSNDNNNNINSMSPPKNRTNLSPLSYFSSKVSDTASLKEESSNYADFYVPHAKSPPSNFLRRSSKRRSYDPTKFKSTGLVKKLDDEISLTSAGNLSLNVPIKDLISPELDKCLPDQEVDPNPMIERYLRDANQDICAGVYPAANDSISVQSDPYCSTDLKTGDLFIPWTKRWSFIVANVTKENKFKHRRSSRKFTSLRRQKSFNTDTLTKKEQSATIRRVDTFKDSANQRSTPTSLRRHNSENSGTLKKRRMSNVSTLSKQSIDYTTLQRESSRHLRQKRTTGSTRFFFEGYQDKLRDDMFYADSSSSCSSPNIETSYDVFTCKLSKEFDAKILSKTYQQLYYIRSRLSEDARKSKFSCDGCFGCGTEIQCTTQTQWV